MEGSVELVDRYGRRCSTQVAVIPARSFHTIRAQGARGVLAYCDPDSRLGHALQSRFLAAHRDRVTDWVAAAGLAINAATSPLEAALRVSEGSRSIEVPHPGLRRALAWIHAGLSGPVRLEDVATTLRISPSRLGHLFSEELGVPFPVYLRWVRLRCAIELVRSGSTLTRAASGAGFSDSSHLTRVVHEMFGMAPSELLPGVRWESSVAGGCGGG
ncbi:helix-turn-helix transcriptional regulator [Streptomyces sp. NPDC056049]|uniref:helix-turn-helix transcriptional regulator n=1 Tax=Streptomyces sp. NPDC056049 TaxID=3345693 RepID=UPI0035DF84E7